MSWTLEIDFEWPRDEGMSARMLEALIHEVVDPLHRENIIVSGTRLELREES